MARVREAAGGRRVVGVMGGGRDVAAKDAALAESFARLVSRSDVAVLTGGGPGIMEAASRGAALAIGVLPGAVAGGGYPNPFVDRTLFTGLGTLDPATGAPGRNLVNVLASDVVVAFRGRAGTASEIRLAIEHARPLALVGWGVDELDDDTRASAARATSPVATFETAVDAAAWVVGRL